MVGDDGLKLRLIQHESILTIDSLYALRYGFTTFFSSKDKNDVHFKRNK